MNERDGNMRLRTLLLLSGIGFLTVTTPISARISSAAILHMLDTDNDATVDLAEARQAGAAVFDRLDSDKDGTLNIDELSGRLTKEEIEAGNPGHKDNLTRDQYLAIVDLRFKGVDSSHDQKLDIQELSSPSGESLVKLIVYRILI
ncbi:EF-hand domain-containing protein [Hyphomicrobium sp. B1]|jgi:hypothetical protein|uniref:calcium-binding protein n=1 Tax=unclassified Hyphomicrobium TaxID=2619925 RepID=UPI0039C0671D